MESTAPKPEEWRPFGDGTYAVSSAGQVKRTKDLHPGPWKPGRTLRQFQNNCGYMRVALTLPGTRKSRSVLVHAIVAEAFLGPRPPSAQVNHKNGIKANNSPENLEYVTGSENATHAHATGLNKSRPPLKRGTDNHRASTNEVVAAGIKRALASGFRRADVARQFNVSLAVVNQIAAGKTWRHVHV